MTTISANILNIFPKYGAKEIKVFIRKNTVRGFVITSSIAILFFFISFVQMSNLKTNTFQTKVIHFGKTDLLDLTQEKPLELRINVPKEISFAGAVKERAGNPVPVPDAIISPEAPEFADLSKMHNASSSGGISNPEGFGDPGSMNTLPKVDINKSIVEEPDPNADVFYEKMPSFDYVKLSKLVKYPEMARKAGIECTVLLRVLIDKTGETKKVLVENSENLLLNQAAVDAIKAYGKFLPAIQNGEAVTCWVSIPVKFKLK